MDVLMWFLAFLSFGVCGVINVKVLALLKDGERLAAIMFLIVSILVGGAGIAAIKEYGQSQYKRGYHDGYQKIIEANTKISD